MPVAGLSDRPREGPRPTSRRADSLGEYRALLKRGLGYLDSDFAKRVAEIGDPVKDLPLLRDTLTRHTNTDDTWIRPELEESIRKLEARGKSRRDRRRITYRSGRPSGVKAVRPREVSSSPASPARESTGSRVRASRRELAPRGRRLFLARSSLLSSQAR